VHPQDYYLEYTLKETMDTLGKRVKGGDPLANLKAKEKKLNDYVNISR
jgi:hypothetical protein